MHHMIRVTFVCIIAALAGRKTIAAENQPLLTQPGKLLFEDDFARTDMKPKWRVGKGFWTVKDGMTTAAENPEDHHGAYAYITPNVDYKDIVAEYSFKMGGANKIHLMMEDSKYKGSHAGHIIRASVMPKYVELVDMKNGGMKNEIHEKLSDPKTTPEEKKEIQDKTATYKITLDPNTWHKARVEVVGDEMLLSVDGTVVGYFKSDGVDHPTKNMIGFTVGGKSAEIRDVKVWEATASPGWSGRRAAVVASLKK